MHESYRVVKKKTLRVEMPLSAALYTPEGRATDYGFVGIVDLPVKDQPGNLVAIDFKSYSKPMAQATAADDHQTTSYSCVLAANNTVLI